MPCQKAEDSFPGQIVSGILCFLPSFFASGKKGEAILSEEQDGMQDYGKRENESEAFWEA